MQWDSTRVCAHLARACGFGKWENNGRCTEFGRLPDYATEADCHANEDEAKQVACQQFQSTATAAHASRLCIDIFFKLFQFDI